MRHKAKHLDEHPAETQDVLLQLKRLLPAEGWLSERMAKLREKAHYARHGQRRERREKDV